jgi:hypothetical protein
MFVGVFRFWFHSPMAEFSRRLRTGQSHFLHDISGILCHSFSQIIVGGDFMVRIGYNLRSKFYRGALAEQLRRGLQNLSDGCNSHTCLQFILIKFVPVYLLRSMLRWRFAQSVRHSDTSIIFCAGVVTGSQD